VLIDIDRLAWIHLIQPLIHLIQTLIHLIWSGKTGCRSNSGSKSYSSIHLRSTFNSPSAHLQSTSGIGLAPSRPRSLSITAGDSCLVHFPFQRPTTIAPCPCQRPHSGCGANTERLLSRRSSLGSSASSWWSLHMDPPRSMTRSALRAPTLLRMVHYCLRLCSCGAVDPFSRPRRYGEFWRPVRVRTRRTWPP
jgi:hypothetical protein